MFIRKYDVHQEVSTSASGQSHFSVSNQGARALPHAKMCLKAEVTKIGTDLNTDIQIKRMAQEQTV